MSQSFELYQSGDSTLHNLDARIKLVLVLCLTMLALIFGSVIVLSALMLLVLLSMNLAHIDRTRLHWIRRVVLPPLALIGLLWIVLYSSETPFLSLWILHLGFDNLAQAVSIMLRLGTIASGTLLWLFTTNQAELVLSLVQLGLPYELGLMLAIAFEQIPGLAKTYAIVKQAHTARALAPDEGDLLHRIRATYPMLIATIINSLRRADELALVMQSRAMGASARRTYLHKLIFSPRDRAWLIATLTTTGGLLAARFFFDIGASPLWLLG